jgi:hypothetical protein
VTKLYQGKLQTVIEDLDLPHPVIHSRYGHGFAKPYARDDRLLRTELLPTASTTMVSTKTWRTFRGFASGCPRSSTSTTTSNRTSWKPSLTVGHCGNWPNRRSCPAASGFPA